MSENPHNPTRNSLIYCLLLTNFIILQNPVQLPIASEYARCMAVDF
ncbi:hypothetical protein APHNYW_0173 [Anaplasma phagocytophilum str. ApNYW]|nr:hypothetical protein APHNYW_0173 [Anaplasma phagocytophilum str. ApNYW]